MSKWRPISTWMPENPSAHWPYLKAMVFAGGVVQEADWKPESNPPESGEWWPANLDSEYGNQIFPTHWMPLPRGPK